MRLHQKEICGDIRSLKWTKMTTDMTKHQKEKPRGIPRNVPMPIEVKERQVKVKKDRVRNETRIHQAAPKTPPNAYPS